MIIRRMVCIKSHGNGEPVLPSMLSAEAGDALIVGDQRAGKVDRSCNQKPICWITMLQAVKLIGVGRWAVT